MPTGRAEAKSKRTGLGVKYMVERKVREAHRKQNKIEKYTAAAVPSAEFEIAQSDGCDAGSMRSKDARRKTQAFQTSFHSRKP